MIIHVYAITYSRSDFILLDFTFSAIAANGTHSDLYHHLEFWNSTWLIHQFVYHKMSYVTPWIKGLIKWLGVTLTSILDTQYQFLRIGSANECAESAYIKQQRLCRLQHTEFISSSTSLFRLHEYILHKIIFKNTFKLAKYSGYLAINTHTPNIAKWTLNSNFSFEF